MVNEVVSKGSLIGLAMVAVSAGINQLVNEKILSGVILVLVGFGFVIWREYLKLKYLQKKTDKKNKRK